MKRFIILLLLTFIFVLSCVTGSAPQEQQNSAEQAKAAETVPPEPPPPRETAPEAPPVEVFDPGSISNEKYAVTKAHIQALVEELNSIIRNRNYNAWLGYLDSSYLELISSREFLDERTEEL
jgi:PBP1b-binding outer membrane lipoprotein LpoB